jgi:tetratricopeptide (TPR) repeat protein
MMRLLGHAEEAFLICEGVEHEFEDVSQSSFLRALMLRGMMLLDRGRTGDQEVAWEIFSFVSSVITDNNLPWMRCVSMAGQETILIENGRIGEALLVCEQHRALARENEDLSALANCIGNEGAAYMQRGDFQKAMALCKEEERIRRELGNLDGLQSCLGQQAQIMLQLKEVENALTYFAEQERICKQIGKLSSLANCYSNQAFVFFSHYGDKDRAISLLHLELSIAEKIGSERQMAIAKSALRAIGVV